MFTTILIGLSIPLIAAMRQRTWTANMMPLITFGVLVIAYVGGEYLDGVEPALTVEYLRGFAFALVSQQSVHRMVKGMPWFQAVEGLGPVQTDQPTPDRVVP